MQRIIINTCETIQIGYNYSYLVEMEIDDGIFKSVFELPAYMYTMS